MSTTTTTTTTTATTTELPGPGCPRAWLPLLGLLVLGLALGPLACADKAPPARFPDPPPPELAKPLAPEAAPGEDAAPSEDEHAEPPGEPAPDQTSG